MHFVGWVYFQIYRWLLLPSAVQILKLFKFLWPAKIQEIISDRQSSAWPYLQARPIWIHAASGELEYAKPVIREVKDRWPHIPILLTYFSPSAKKLTKDLLGVDAFLPLPWDRRRDMARFINHFQPRASLVARSDLWPEMAVTLKKRETPILLFSATHNPKFSWLSWLFSPLKFFVFNHLNELACVSLDDKKAFEKWDLDVPVKALGDTRFDQVIYRLQNPRSTKKLKAQGLVFVAGSTWGADEDVLFANLNSILKNGAKLILAPHEVSEKHMQDLELKIQKQGFSFSRYSQISEWKSEILILDTVGILAELYSLGHLAFVGGSFKAKVHSVMEPLAAGLPVLVGPFHHNNREALQFKQKTVSENLTMVSVAENADQMQKILQDWQARLPNDQVREHIRSEVKASSGATRHVTEWLSQFIS